MISDKEHKSQLDVLHELYRERIRKMEDQHRTELQQARDLKELLGKFGSKLSMFDSNFSISGSMNFPDDIPQYVDDFFGGKVIKQEATKVIFISRKGEVQTGLTKRKPDEHFPYLLQREAP